MYTDVSFGTREEGAGIPQQTLEFWLVIFILSYITLKAVVRLR